MQIIMKISIFLVILFFIVGCNCNEEKESCSCPVPHMNYDFTSSEKIQTFVYEKSICKEEEMKLAYKFFKINPKNIEIRDNFWNYLTKCFSIPKLPKGTQASYFFYTDVSDEIVIKISTDIYPVSGRKF